MSLEEQRKYDLVNKGNGEKGSVKGIQSVALKSRQEKEITEKPKFPDLEELDEDEVDVSCGIWVFRTNLFGKYFSNLFVFATLVGLATLFTTMVDRIVPVQLKSLEKQFNIDNAKAGLLTSASKFGLMSTILIAGHFTKKSNIPMIIGLSGVLQGFILMVPAILQLVDPYELELIDSTNNTNSTSNSNKYLCNHTLSGPDTSKNNDTGTKEAKVTNQLAFIIVLVVQVLKGITDTFHSFFLPNVYMDDNVIEKSKMSIYMGIRQLFSSLAQPLGTEINGVLTEIPIDLKETEMDATDSRFVAAWWLAFLIFGAGTALTSFPLMLFPKRLISKKKQKQALDKAVITFAGGHLTEEKNTEVSNEPEKKIVPVPSRHHSLANLKEPRNSLDLPRKASLASIGISGSRRPSLLFPPLEGPTERKVSITGDIVFDQPIKLKTTASGKQRALVELLKDFPKALYRLFRLPIFILILADVAIISIPYNGIAMFRNTYMANEYNIRMSEVSYASGVSTAIGQISGTLTSTWLASRVRTKEGYVWIMMASYVLQTCLNPFYIVFGCDNESVYGAQGSIGVQVNTSSLCDCASSKQLLSCGSDGNNYLSPCYAGCSTPQGKNFLECNLLQNSTSGSKMVTPGLCPTDCQTNFMVYVVLHGVQSLVEGASSIPRNLLTLRLVDARDRAFAMSFLMFFYNIISIPSPNLFGSIIDGSCLIWDGEFCTLYDREKIRYLLAGVDIGINVAIMITLSLNILLFRLENRKRLKLEQSGQLQEQEGVNIEIVITKETEKL
ncbi:solute carrier organic anion transporter family member 2B1-like [Biomphalaria glabrata]|uniref:Solute carrier organic anion transporter family member 2B1-like n=1 Tax=Biomphalaria glabrata TaxID=6526 RepID=A0A9W3AYP8_BIOGL|nr:solute carrier organic anion transporter family member 2B1-like [Biomphalaria glabrata]XP_055892335.1 solute carrier organic anion transporter family member 2B1-like [Biomphalaria glabrata]